MRIENRMKRWVGLGALAIAVAALAFTPATAGGRHHRHGKGGHHKEHRVRAHDHRPHRADHGRHGAYHGRVRAPHGRHGAYYGQARSQGAFVIPGDIGHRHAGLYRSYYHGREYFRPHRHHHAVYHFPAHTSAGYVWRPHSYCDGRLHAAHVAYRGPKFSVSVSF